MKHSREVPADAGPELQEFLPGQRPLLEAQLIDLADEIAYATADLDDAAIAGLITLDHVAEFVPFAAELAEQLDTQFPGASERVRFWEVQRQLMNVLIGGLIEGTVRAAEAAGVETSHDVRTLDHRLAQLTLQASEIKAQLRALLVDRVYLFAKLVEDRTAAAAQMNELFDYLLENPDRVSSGYRESLANAPVYRVVCDYIAGMTDAYLRRIHAELIGEATRG